MTKEEVRVYLNKMDVSEKTIRDFEEKYDVEVITRLVDESSDPKEAINSIHRYYPELQVEELNKQCDFIAQQIKAGMDSKNGKIQELTEDELSNVAGGGLFDWFSDLSNGWKAVIIGATVGLAVAGLTIGIGAALGCFSAAASSSLAGGSTVIGTALILGGWSGMGAGHTAYSDFH